MSAAAKFTMELQPGRAKIHITASKNTNKNKEHVLNQKTTRTTTTQCQRHCPHRLVCTISTVSSLSSTPSKHMATHTHTCSPFNAALTRGAAVCCCSSAPPQSLLRLHRQCRWRGGCTHHSATAAGTRRQASGQVSIAANHYNGIAAAQRKTCKASKRFAKAKHTKQTQRRIPPHACLHLSTPFPPFCTPLPAPSVHGTETYFRFCSVLLLFSASAIATACLSFMMPLPRLHTPQRQAQEDRPCGQVGTVCTTATPRNVTSGRCKASKKIAKATRTHTWNSHPNQCTAQWQCRIPSCACFTPPPPPQSSSVSGCTLFHTVVTHSQLDFRTHPRYCNVLLTSSISAMATTASSQIQWSQSLCTALKHSGTGTSKTEARRNGVGAGISFKIAAITGNTYNKDKDSHGKQERRAVHMHQSPFACIPPHPHHIFCF